MAFLKKNNYGFTLVELSIVLIVIALVIAGVLTGQTLIKNAKLISVYDDITKFTNAFSSFKDSYKALPGDLDAATAFPNFQGAGSNRNDGIIQWTPAFSAGGNQASESILAWHHLFIAGLNDFNPIFSASSVALSVIDETTRNIPASKIQGLGYLIFCDDTNGTSTALKIHAIQLAPPTWAGGGAPNGQGPGLSGEDSFFLDTKYDDGVPNNGSIRALDNPAVNDCVSTTSAYQVGANNKDMVCFLRFVLPR
jgi:prepilin-type N-terminal cleavage/methylation domain-containing protein